MQFSHSALLAALALTSPASMAGFLGDLIPHKNAPPVAEQPITTVPCEPCTLSAIHFAGNNITQTRTMLRELLFKPGDAVSSAQLEQGRQAIQNLGLFKKVTMSAVADEKGAVAVTFIVTERWYLLGYPRVDANANGEYAYGVQADWNNVWGLNHTLRLSLLRKETKREGVGKENNFVVGYNAPQLLDSRWSLNLGGAFIERPVNNELGQYNERFESYQVIGSRSLGKAEPNQGWSVGSGLLWTIQSTDTGIGEYGEALSPVAIAGYRDLRFNVYSEEGLVYGSRLDVAKEGVAADYDFARLTMNAARYLRVGSTPHQTVHFIGETGLNWEGPQNVRTFTLGGVGALRGYPRGFREGNAYYRVAAEWVRPVFKPWLRALVIAEAGNVYAQPNEFEPDDIKASIGVGIRIRVPFFVNVQLEAGVALPLDGGGARFFGGQVN